MLQTEHKVTAEIREVRTSYSQTSLPTWKNLRRGEAHRCGFTTHFPTRAFRTPEERFIPKPFLPHRTPRCPQTPPDSTSTSLSAFSKQAHLGAALEQLRDGDSMSAPHLGGPVGDQHLSEPGPP